MHRQIAFVAIVLNALLGGSAFALANCDQTCVVMKSVLNELSRINNRETELVT